MSTEFEIDPSSWEFRNNAIPIIHRLLREQPVVALSDGRFLLCRHADVGWALKDHDAVRRPTEWSNARKPPGPFRDFGESNMIGMNPPDHTRFRKSIMRAFAPKRVEALREFTGKTCDELIDNMLQREAGDFIDDFALPLPVAVICAMLDIPFSDLNVFRKGSAAMLAGLEISTNPDEVERAGEAAQMLFDYLSDVASVRERNLGDDLLSLLITHEQEDQLTRPEVIWAAITLIIAGHETTAHLIGNGLLALIRNPEQLQLLVDRPELNVNAVEEFLRYDPSLYMLFRETTKEARLDDIEIPVGALLFLSLAAANRDPRVFDDPDTLDITRHNAKEHHTFAAGRHLCAGHAVARLEGQIAFTKLTERLRDFELDSDPVPREGLMFKGYHSMPIRYRSRG